MTSMISYFGHVETCEDKQPSCGHRWDGAKDLGANLSIRCPECQLRILLDQSLAAAYYLKFYGARCHEVINDYIEELNADICYRFSRSCGKQFTDNFVTVYNTLLSLVKFNRGGNWTDVNIALIDEFLFDGNTRCEEPVAFCKCKRSALITWLMWMNKGVHPNYREFSDTKGCKIVSFDLCDRSNGIEGLMRISLESHEIGDSFSYERTVMDQLPSCPLLGYLSHFNWSKTCFETCIGIITNFCLHTDIQRQGISMSHHLAYCLKQGMFYPRFNLAGNNDGIDPIMSKYHDQLFNAFLAFIKFCSSARGMTMIDKNIVAKAFGCFAYTKEQKESVSYLEKADAVPSADEFKSFKKVMGSVESLQLISQSPSLYSAQADVKVTGSTEANTDDGKGEGKTDQKDSGKDNQEAEKKDSDAGKKDDGKEDDDSEPSDDDDGADDFNEDDTTGDDMTEFDAGDVGGDNQSGGSSDPGASNDNTSSTDNGGTPDDVNTADDEGIDFVITPPEMATVDSVLFREEMYKFLTNVLTNPPKCMSPQDIATLTILKRCWLSCLSIETIKGIVEACIRLPLSIKHSIHKSTELNK